MDLSADALRIVFDGVAAVAELLDARVVLERLYGEFVSGHPCPAVAHQQIENRSLLTGKPKRCVTGK
jgi:hypothetical protein